jgi:DNA (cytosine-5)-methyltransferase 1
MGFFRAGFEVVGYDIEPQPNYPFEFHRADILSLDPAWITREFHAVVGSPPCQAHTTLRATSGREYVNLIPGTRFLMFETGLPYVIENVPGAPLIDPVTLCGSSFGMPLRRHRLFEANWPLRGLPCDHAWQSRHQPYRRFATRREPQPTGVVSVHGGNQMAGDPGNRLAAIAMGIDWMTYDELTQAIPPAYTYFIGKQLLEHVRRK